MAGRLRTSINTSKARSPRRSLRSSARATYSRGIRCDERIDLSAVMPGLVPGIHVVLCKCDKDVDGRDKPGHDGSSSHHRLRLTMPIVYEKLLALKIPDVEHRYGAKDCMLYALGVGLGVDPVDEEQLAFVYEKNLKALPTMAVVLGHPGFWVQELDTGIDWVKAVAGEHALVLHQPLRPSAAVLGRTRLLDVIDKGKDKGAIIYSERIIDDKATGERVATIGQTTFCRGDGGFGGPPREQRPVHPIPERPPDLACDLPTRPEAALIYRLSAD